MLNRHLKTLLGMSFALVSLGIFIGCGSGNPVQLPPKKTPTPHPTPQPPLPPDSDDAQDEINACIGFTECTKFITDSAIAKAIEFSDPNGNEKPPKEFRAGEIKLKKFDKAKNIVELLYENLEEEPDKDVKVKIHGEVTVTLKPIGDNGMEFNVSADKLKVTISEKSDSIVWDTTLNINNVQTIIDDDTSKVVKTGKSAFKTSGAQFAMKIESPINTEYKGEEETIMSGQIKWLANKNPISITYDKGKVKVNGKEIPDTH